MVGYKEGPLYMSAPVQEREGKRGFSKSNPSPLPVGAPGQAPTPAPWRASPREGVPSALSPGQAPPRQVSPLVGVSPPPGQAAPPPGQASPQGGTWAEQDGIWPPRTGSAGSTSGVSASSTWGGLIRLFFFFSPFHRCLLHYFLYFFLQQHVITRHKPTNQSTVSVRLYK